VVVALIGGGGHGVVVVVGVAGFNVLELGTAGGDRKA
jgi:hypothetical protein